MPRTSGAKVQLSLTLSLDELVKIQRIVETDGSSLSRVVQRIVSEALAKI
jgi:hypothetical protein